MGETIISAPGLKRLMLVDEYVRYFFSKRHRLGLI